MTNSDVYAEFNAQMTSLADAIREKTDHGGEMTVADMLSALKGEEYSPSGSGITAFEDAMRGIADAIREKCGISSKLSIADMASALSAYAAVYVYSSCVDEMLLVSRDFAIYNRASVVLPAGEYTNFKIHGIGKSPDRIKMGSSIAGYNGTDAEYSYSGETVTIERALGGRLTLIWENGGGDISLTPVGNGTPGFSWPSEVRAAEADQTAQLAVFPAYTLNIEFDSFEQ